MQRFLKWCQSVRSGGFLMDCNPSFRNSHWVSTDRCEHPTRMTFALAQAGGSSGGHNLKVQIHCYYKTNPWPVLIPFTKTILKNTLDSDPLYYYMVLEGKKSYKNSSISVWQICRTMIPQRLNTVN